MSAPTTVAIFTADEWAERLLRLYPNNWTGDSAKTTGGILYSLFKAQSTQYNFLQDGLEWLLNACRIATATDVALDAIANDYFGTLSKYEASVVRLSGEADDDFRQRIYANLFQTGGTRADIIRVIHLLTGGTPRFIEPWNVLDTSACDSFSFLDIDTPANPCRAGDLNLPYQGFVESDLPAFGDQGNNPVYCIDVGLSCDRSFIVDPQPTWFLGQKSLDLAINRVRMAGTIIWRRYGAPVTVEYARGNSPTPGADAIELAVTLFPPCIRPLVVLACAGWNSQVSARATSNGEFVLRFQTPAPGDKSVDWIAAPITLSGYGRLNVAAGSTTLSIAIPDAMRVLLATPSWNTSIWLTAMESGTAAFEFSTPAPANSILNYGSFDSDNSGTESVAADATSVVVDLPTELTDGYQLILLPSWNTEFVITKTSTQFTVVFSVPPADDSFFCWGVLSQPI